MVYDGMIIALVVGFLRRGSLKGFLSLRLRYGWIFPLLLLVQVVVYFLQNRFDWVAHYSPYSFMLVYIIGMGFLWLNRNERGFYWILFGVLLNFLVMAINGGRMPVSGWAAEWLQPGSSATLTNNLFEKHQLLTGSTILGFLGDVIPKPYPPKQVISIGDIIMSIGVIFYIQKIMLTYSRREIRTQIRTHK